MSRPTLDLAAEVITPDGTRYRWEPSGPPGNRLQNISWRTRIGEGFSDASGQLSRRIDLDYPDLQLGSSVTLVSGDGTIAYEGRLEAAPRDLSDSHSISLTMAGWMAHAKDRRFSEIYVDRDLSAWTGMTLRRRMSRLSAGFPFTPYDMEQTTDPVSSRAGFSTAFTGAWAAGFPPMAEAWYDAGPGVSVGKVSVSWQREGSTIVVADANWTWTLYATTDDDSTTFVSSGNLRAAGPGTATVTTTADGYRYASAQLYYATSPAGADGSRYAISWYKPAVYGRHGLTLYTGEAGEPDGVLASDVIKNIAARYCPMLNTSGVDSTSYVIQHLAFRDRTYPYDAFLEVNKYHLWHLGVWENKTLTFTPYDLTDYDWEIRTDDPGTTFSPQGPSTESLFNGVVVTYTDLLTGMTNVLTPDDNPELRDDSYENPWNQAGVEHWKEDVQLSTPTLEAQALQLGRAILADTNRPKTPGTITVRGYVRDRQGNEQPVWKIHAGDTIAVTNFPNDSPRLIHETSYDDAAKTNTLAIDAPASSLDAYLDRQSAAVAAKGLG